MKQRMSFWVLVLFSVLTLSLVSCGADLPGLGGGGSSSSGGGGKKKAPPTNGLIWVDVEPWPSATIYLGDTQKFTATGWYNDASTRDLTSWATWTSSNTTVATVSGSGLATSKALGWTDIKASYGGINDTVTLYVDPVPITLQSIDVTPASATVQVGATRQFTATGHYSDNSTQNITSSSTWTSSAPSTAFISDAPGTKGLATGMAAGGPVTITVTKSGVTGTASLMVTPPMPDLKVRVTSVIANGTDVVVSYTVKNAGLANSTAFDVDVWADSATVPSAGEYGDASNSYTSLDSGSTLNDYVTIPSSLVSGTAYTVVDTADAVPESDETNNVSAGYSWPFTVSCAGLVNNFGGLCYDIGNGFILNAPTGGYLSYGGYTFDDNATSGTGPKNVCSLALFGDGGVVLGQPTSASTTYDYSLSYQQHWNGYSASCGYQAALIDVGTTINWTYPIGDSCAGNTYTDYPTASLTCMYPALTTVIAPITYDFNDSNVPTDFSMSGNLPWTIDVNTLRSGLISHSQTTCFAVTAAITNGVSFDRSVSSEGCCDHLNFYVDGSPVDSWSGTVSWGTVDYPQTIGTHEYKWCYVKDSSVNSGSDAAWVDNINIH